MQQFPAVTTFTARHRDATAVYRLVRRADKNVAAKRGLYVINIITK